MINVTKSIIEDNGKYLLIKRSSNSKFFPNKWDFPGGKIREGEDPSTSVKRETREETSLDIEVGKQIIEDYHTENKSKIHYRIFLVKTYQDNIELSEDHSDFAWLSKEQMKKYELTPFVKKFLEKS